MTTFNQGVRQKPIYTRTHEGGSAVVPSTLVDLAFTAACTFIGQNTFYESADERTQRIISLVQKAAKADPDGVVDLIRKIRRDFKIRAAAILIAAEFVHAAPGHRTREAVANAMWRADEPAEFLAYWFGRFGKAVPRGVKLGLGDAVRKLYTERNVLKWDSKDRAVRMGDVLEVCHVKPETPEQATLYRYLLDIRHRGTGAWAIDTQDDAEVRMPADDGHWMFRPDHLTMFRNRQILMAVPEDQRRLYLNHAFDAHLGAAGMTWENLSSWLPGGMDAEAWQFAIPQMQVMALIRNLRNFDKVGLPEQWVDRVIAKITSEEDVRASRIFPYQVLTAYRFAESDNWKRALGKTLEYASGNVPSLPRSLILIDTSRSMLHNLSGRSQIAPIEVAALQAVSVAKHSTDVDIAIYGTQSMPVSEAEWRTKSVLGATSHIRNLVGAVGHGTYGHTAMREHFDPKRHDRVIIFTDDQQLDSGNVDISHIPQVVTFNIGGYQPKSTWGRVGGRTNIQVAGFSDEVFRVITDLLVGDISL